MATTTDGTPETEQKPTVRDRVTDVLREAAEDARLPKSVEDALQDAAYATRRAITRGQRRVGDLKDEAIYRVKRQPLQVVAGAFGIGLVLGLAAAWVTRRPTRYDDDW